MHEDRAMTCCTIKHDWGGDGTVYVIREDNGDRLLISPEEWPHGDIVPVELVRDYMIEVAA